MTACLFIRDEFEDLGSIERVMILSEESDYNKLFCFIDNAVKNKIHLQLEISGIISYSYRREEDHIYFSSGYSEIDAIIAYMEHVDAEYDIITIGNRRKQK